MPNMISTSLPLTLKEVLHVYLLCFEAAADALPQDAVEYVEVYHHHPRVSVPIWQIWTHEDVVREGPPISPNLLSELPEGLHEALARKDLCDFFCRLIEREVSEKVAERFGGSAIWVTAKPKIDFLLAVRGSWHQLNVADHSVLLVETADEERVIMDGTLRQYLWEPSTWLQTVGEWEDRRVDKSDGGKISTCDPSFRQCMDRDMHMVDMGYWLIIRERMDKLFKDLDWEELEGLKAEQRVARVKQMARDAFAGAWAEAKETKQGE